MLKKKAENCYTQHIVDFIYGLEVNISQLGTARLVPAHSVTEHHVYIVLVYLSIAIACWYYMLETWSSGVQASSIY